MLQGTRVKPRKSTANRPLAPAVGRVGKRGRNRGDISLRSPAAWQRGVQRSDATSPRTLYGTHAALLSEIKFAGRVYITVQQNPRAATAIRRSLCLIGSISSSTTEGACQAPNSDPCRPLPPNTNFAGATPMPECTVAFKFKQVASRGDSALYHRQDVDQFSCNLRFATRMIYRKCFTASLLNAALDQAICMRARCQCVC